MTKLVGYHKYFLMSRKRAEVGTVLNILFMGYITLMICLLNPDKHHALRSAARLNGDRREI